jgi:hypothetical protein
MMSGALVPAGFASGCLDSDEGDDGDVTSSPDEAVRVPLSWGGWSRSTFGLRWVGFWAASGRKCLRSVPLPD